MLPHDYIMMHYPGVLQTANFQRIDIFQRVPFPVKEQSQHRLSYPRNPESDRLCRKVPGRPGDLTVHEEIGSDLMRAHRFCIAFLAASLVSFPLFAQLTPPGVVPGTNANLYGTLTITAPEGAAIPSGLSIVLYRLDKSVFGRQPIANKGNYRFERVPNGDYEIAIEAEGKDLLRINYTMNSVVKNDERRLNLDLDMRTKPGARPVKAGTISVKDVYPRNPSNTAVMEQALAASAKKNYGEAAKMLRTVVETDPKDFEAWTELGTVLFAQGNQGEAEKAFQRALGEQQAYAPAQLNLGKLYYNQKNYEQAVKVLAQLVAAHPEAADARRFLGESYLRIKKGSLAVSELEEAARLDPAGQADGLLSLAALYDAAGLKDRAAAVYEKFLSIKPDYPEKKKLEKYVKDNKKL